MIECEFEESLIIVLWFGGNLVSLIDGDEE
jgi:hypothetical protein